MKKNNKIDFEIVLVCLFVIALFGGFAYFMYSLKKEGDEANRKRVADADADRKREPDFKLEKVDTLENKVFFTFGGKKYEFQSKIEKTEQYAWRDFILKVRDFYENDVFKKIDFRLFKGNEQIAVLHPKIDYRLW